MPLLPFNQLARLFVCPRCQGEIKVSSAAVTCATCKTSYERANFGAQWPVIIDSESSVVDAAGVLLSGETSVINRRRGGNLLTPLRSLVTPRNGTAVRSIKQMCDELSAEVRRPRILVVGGGAVGNGVEHLYHDSRVDVIGFDIYPSSNVQFVADGHRIPLKNGSVDGVVIQAVLEHVLEPATVVTELHRVLSPNGLVYSDTPFMQQVHEGPYDFTRFTESGHRYLFRDFEEIDSGVVAGLGTQMRWSLDYFARALFRSRWAGTATRLLFFWLSYLDKFLSQVHSVDGASSVYFLGRRSESRLTPVEAVRRYRGAQTVGGDGRQ